MRASAASRPCTSVLLLLTAAACVLTAIAGSPALGADEIHFTIKGQTAVTFDWRGTESTLRYGLTTAYGQTVTGVAPVPLPYSSTGPFWEARITGLTENTLYHYSIGSGPDHTFRTPPPLGSSNFTVYVEGDIGDARTYPNVGVVQSLISRDLPSFVLPVGDLTYGNAHGMTVVDQHFNDLMVWSQDTAYMPAWGNHEWDKSTDDLRNYKGRFDLPNPQTSPGSPAISCCGEDWYWFDYGNVRFIAYPEPWSGAWSDWKTKVAPVMDAAQADPKITFIVTFGHRPTLSSGHHPGDSTLLGYMNTLASAHSKYVLNLFGHSHNYERSTPQSGVIHVTAGTGGSTLEQDGTCLYLTCTQPSWSAKRIMHLGPLKLSFTATGITGQLICGPAGGGTNDVTCTVGSVIDTFAIGTPVVDTASPTVAITAPAAGASVTGTSTVSANASDNVAVVGVQFKLDGASLGAEDSSSPYSVSWNSATAPNGAHTLTATARDAAGNTATAPGVSVTVSNTADTTPPTSAFTAPAAGATLSGAVTVSATATDNVSVAGVQFKVDGVNLGAEDTSSPYSVSWNTATATAGSHTLSATARDAAGNVGPPSTLTVSVNNPPDVSLTAPGQGSTLSLTTTVSASASDDGGVSGVQFKLDGASLGAEDTTSPYAVSWDTTAASNGVHSLTAVARDASGATGTSAAVSVTVLNGASALITDPNAVFTVPGVPKPGYLVQISDPVFRTKIKRISNDGGQSVVWTGPPSGSGTWGADARQHYSKDQPWNSDGTLIKLENRSTPANLMLDGNTYQVRYGECSNYSIHDDRWHPSPAHPHERINAGGTELMWFDVISCTKTRTWTLPFSVDYFGSGEGNPSNDGRWALLGDSTRIFVVDMDPQSPQSPYPNKRIGPALAFSGCGLSDCTADWVSISASGKYAVVMYNGDHPRVYDVNPTTLALTPRPMPASTPECSGHDPAQGFIFDLGHADLALNPFDNNEDVMIGQMRGWCPTSVNSVALGGVVMVRLRDGQVTSLMNPGNDAQAHHISTRNYDRPGWVYVGYYPDPGKRFNDEIVAIKMDGSRTVERLAHKHSVFTSCYRCESHAVPSRDGKRVLWASNWMQDCGAVCGPASDIKAYVLDTRALVQSDTTPPGNVPELRRVVP